VFKFTTEISPEGHDANASFARTDAKTVLPEIDINQANA
jgi:hypothetical protein